MTWEEHEKEYGIILTDIPDNIEKYDSIPDNQWYSDANGSSYGTANKRCDHLTYEYNDMLGFGVVRVGDTLHCICNDDLYVPSGYDSKGDRLYASWVLERIVRTAQK